jgi:hypothetical protein
MENMKIIFLKDVIVEVMEPSSGTNDTYDKLIRQGTTVEVDELIPLSENFSVFHFNDEVWIDIRNDLFREVVA